MSSTLGWYFVASLQSGPIAPLHGSTLDEDPHDDDDDIPQLHDYRHTSSRQQMSCRLDQRSR